LWGNAVYWILIWQNGANWANAKGCQLVGVIQAICAQINREPLRVRFFNRCAIAFYWSSLLAQYWFMRIGETLAPLVSVDQVFKEFW
jgi:hypothetical protein